MPTEIIIIFLLLLFVAITFAITRIIKNNNWFPKSDNKTDSLTHNSEDCFDPLRSDIAISEVESFTLKSITGEEITLTRPNAKQLADRKYKEVCIRSAAGMGQVTQGIMPMLSQAQTLADLAKVAPNGLFTATAPIQDLMKYADGTVGSIVLRGKTIAEHSGFAEVALKVVNPASVIGGTMQAMALISGQYYMDEISKQLRGVSQKLDKLIGFHHDEKIGILRNIKKELSEIVSKANVDTGDIIACQSMGKQCGEIYFEYLTRLESSTVEAKKQLLNKAKELRELGISIDDNEINLSIKMCYQSSALSEKCKVAELAVRLKQGSGQAQFIAELSKALKVMKSEAFHHNAQQYIEEHYAPVIEKSERIVETAKIPVVHGNVSAEKENLLRRKESVIDFVDDDASASILVENVLQLLCEPKETIIMLGATSEEQRFFILDNDD